MDKKQAQQPVVKKNTAVAASKGTKMYWSILVLGLALAVGGFFYKDNDTLDSFVAETENNAELAAGVGASASEFEGTPVADSKLSGVLQNSDNPARGNMKLDSKLGQIYIRTEKDFRALVGANVSLIIEGTLENFRLVDVVRN